MHSSTLNTFRCQFSTNLNRINYLISAHRIKTLVIVFRNSFSFNFRVIKGRFSLSSILIRVNRNFPSSRDTVCPETMSVNNSGGKTSPGHHGDRLQAFRGCVRPHQHRRFSLISFSLMKFFI